MSRNNPQLPLMTKENCCLRRKSSKYISTINMRPSRATELLWNSNNFWGMKKVQGKILILPSYRVTAPKPNRNYFWACTMYITLQHLQQIPISKYLREALWEYVTDFRPCFHNGKGGGELRCETLYQTHLVCVRLTTWHRVLLDKLSPTQLLGIY